MFLYKLIFSVIILIFGVAVSACFAGISMNRRSILSIVTFCVLDGLLQLTISTAFSDIFMKQLYPLITHLPLILLFVLVHKCSMINAIVSVLIGFICSQFPRWCSIFIQSFFDNIIIYAVIYVLSAALIFYIIYRHVAELVQIFMTHTTKNALLLASVPFIYYILHYGGTIYTNWLSSNNKIAVHFILTVSCLFYVVSIIYCYHELASQQETKHLAESLNQQLEYAAITLDNMRTLQTQTITYRHDMRHHFAYLQALAATGDLEKIQNYIHTIQSDIDAITPKRFCQNELVNLILSTYDTKAAKKQITLNIQAPIPKDLPISDTRLCAILSNALENALQATENSANKTIEIRLAIRNSALLIQISNPFVGTVAYNNQIPSASQSDHGFGTKSIATIADSYHGQYEFIAENQVFTVRVLLPLNNSL